MEPATRMRSVRAGRSTFMTPAIDAMQLMGKDSKAQRFLLLTVAMAVWTCTVIVVGHTRRCMALLAFAFCGAKDVAGLCEQLLAFWIGRSKKLNRSKQYTFGFGRFEVLATFAFAIITGLGALYSIKESVAQAIAHEPIVFEDLFSWACAAIALHLLTTYLISHPDPATTGGRGRLWIAVQFLRTFLTDPGHRQRTVSCALLMGSVLTIELTANAVYVDTAAGLLIGLLLAGSTIPGLERSGSILLQTVPSITLNRLQKSLREISTFDGVLEFGHVRFWMISHNELAGSIHVRVRRDAREQDVLAQVTNKLAHIIPANNLTVQVIKDDWMATAQLGTPASTPSRTRSNELPHSPKMSMRGPMMAPLAPPNFGTPAPSART